MAGIYIHIPFCKQACSYCDFHFATSLKYKDDMLKAIQQEMVLAQDFIEDKEIETVYFGGGTPSLLSATELNYLLDTLSKYYNLSNVKEWTLEANPDDLTKDYLKSLKQYTPIDRLSIGIQSFQEHDLKIMNRAHNVTQAQYCIPLAQDIGFSNLSCDLIFGTPTLTNDQLSHNIKCLQSHQVQHISAYALTIEQNTPLYKKIKNAQFIPAPDTHYETQMLQLIQELTLGGYQQYEISNYALPGYEAVHNTNYWRQKPYWGFGPSAHGYNGNVRRWNVRNNQKYIQSLISHNKIDFESEVLTEKDKINEYIMTSLRTMWGIDYAAFEGLFGSEALKRLRLDSAAMIEKGLLDSNEGHLLLSLEAKIISDSVISELFFS